MARITLGSGITSINGKIGGTVYQGSASGTIAKNRGYKTKSTSSQTSKAQSLLTVLNQYWQTMSDTDRGTWNSYAIFKPTLQKNGSGRYLNGQQLFLYYAYRYYTQFNGIPSPPPFVNNSLEYAQYQILNDGGDLYLNSSLAPDESSIFTFFKISNSVPVGRNYATGGVKQIRCEFSGSTNAIIAAPYLALYGRVPSVGEYVIIEVQQVMTSFAVWSNITRLKLQVQSF